MAVKIITVIKEWDILQRLALVIVIQVSALLYVALCVFGAFYKVERPKWLKWINDHFNLIKKI